MLPNERDHVLFYAGYKIDKCVCDRFSIHTVKCSKISARKWLNSSWYSSFYYCTVIILLSLLAFQNVEAQSQDYYYTVDGVILMNGVLNDSAIIAKSKKVTVLLDYETAKFDLYFDIATVQTGIDSLDKLLAKQEGNFIEFEGKLGIEYVQTQSHAPQDFEVEGYLDCDYQCGVVQGKGRLEHIFGGTYSCVLTLSFLLNKNQLPFIIPLKGLHNEFTVDVIQTILKRTNE